MQTRTTIEIKEEIAQHLKNNWQIIDIVNHYKICPATIRKINKMYNCNRIIPADETIGYLRKRSKIKNNINIMPEIINECNKSNIDETIGYLRKRSKIKNNINIMPKVINECINKNIDDYGIELNLEALKYFEENTKKFFNPNLFDVEFKCKRERAVIYRIYCNQVFVNYIYNETQEFFKFQFVNDFYKNKLIEKNCKELFKKRKMFEYIKDNNNQYCIFDLDRFLNDIAYKNAVNEALITKVAPKI